MKKRTTIRYILALCAALGWWGALYPELCLTPDTVRVVREESTSAEPAYTGEADAGLGGAAQLYWELLEADRGQIRFKSRLAEAWQEWKESNGSAK